MGKVRKKISKLIPKEAKPFLPYIAAAIPGVGMGLGAFSGTGAMGSFLRAGLAKGLSDDQANLKDVLRTGAIAAAPQTISKGIGSLGQGSGKFADFLNKTKTLKDGTETISIVDKVSSMANPETLGGGIKLAGAQGTVDYGIKAAELNKDALERYNADLLAQGIGDKVARRTAIFDIFQNAGYDDDDVNKLLDKYSYAKGGKVDKPVVPADELAKILEEFMKQQDKQEEIRRQNKADGGRVGLEAGGDPEKAALVQEVKRLRDELDDKKTTKGVQSGMEYATKGFEQALGGPLGGAVAKPMRIIPGFARGGITDIDVNETITETENEPEGMALNTDLLREYRSYKMEQEELGMPVIPFREWFGMTYGASRAGVAEGGIMNASRIDTDDVAQSLFQEYLDMGMTPDQAAAAVRDYLDSSKMGLKDGGKVIPIMPKGVFYKGKAKDYPGVSKAMKNALKKRREKKAEGGLLGLKMGGVPAELDYRGGGMIQVGSKEKADDVPARLSKNEFVMTADAVKGAGGGDPRRGAERMYQMMDQFEAKV